MLYFFAAVALWLLLPPLVRQFIAWKRKSDAERSFAIRFTAFAWLLGVVFLIGFIRLPALGRVILLVPLLLAGTTLAKWWQTSRERLRQRAAEEATFERARRIN